MGESGITKKRIFYYDFLRCFAIIGIVICHVSATIVSTKNLYGTEIWFTSLFFNSLRDIAVPLFVVISGALLLGRNESFASFTKKRFVRVIIPYVFWMFVFVIIGSILASHSIHFGSNWTFSRIFFSVFSLKPTGSAAFFWFVPMIISVYIMIFILNKLSEELPEIYVIALIISLITVVLMNMNILSFKKPNIYPLYTIYALIGYFLSRTDFTLMKFRINENKLAICFFVLFLGLYVLIFLLEASITTNNNKLFLFSQFSYLKMIMVSSIFLSARYFSLSTGKLKDIYDMIETSDLGVIITSISFASFGIYLSHPLIHILLRQGLLALDMPGEDLIFLVLLFILTFSISWLLVLCLSKVPYLDKVSGCG